VFENHIKTERVLKFMLFKKKLKEEKILLKYSFLDNSFLL